MRKKTEEKRQAILQAAEEIFQKDGFERASMAQICAQAGFSKATLYSYYDSKQELFMEVMLGAANAEFEQLLSYLEGDISDFIDALTRFSRAFVHFVFSPRAQAIRRLMAAEGSRVDLGRLCYELGPVRARKTMVKFMDQEIAKGNLIAANTDLMAFQLSGLLKARWSEQFIFQVVDAISEAEIESSVEEALSVFLTAYGTEQGKAGFRH